MASKDTLRIKDLADLRSAPVSADTTALLICKTTVGDGLGGFYMWDASASGDEDTTYMNTIPSSVSTTGRWVRIFQKVRTYPQPVGVGTLVKNGGVKNLYVSSVINSNSEVTIYLTDNGTATGNALFKEIWSTDAEVTANVASSNDVVIGCRKSVSADLKTITFAFSRGNNQTLGATLLSIAGTVIPGLRGAQTGLPVLIRIDGV